jgi:hypothetical protein
MQTASRHKIALCILVFLGAAMAIVWWLRQADEDSASALPGTTIRQAEAGAPDIHRPMQPGPDSSLRSGESPWLTKSPSTTASNSPADLIKNRPVKRDNPCGDLMGRWQDADGNAMVLEPHGHALWLALGRGPVQANWVCRKGGDIELILEGDTIELQPGQEGQLAGRGEDSRDHEWIRGNLAAY